MEPERVPYRTSPNPLLNMGVEIRPQWRREYQALQRMLGLSGKDTINWIVDKYFQEHSRYE